MRHFMKLAELNVLPLAHAIQFRDDLWEADGEGAVIRFRDPQPRQAWLDIPQVRAIVFDTMRLTEATRLGIVQIEKNPAGSGGSIKPADGKSAIWHEIVLQNLSGSDMEIGGELVQFQAGEMWMWRITEATPAKKVNESKDDSISLLMDLGFA